MGKKKKGFTLVELLVVIAIIGILAAVIAPNAFRAIEKSKVSAFTSDVDTIKKAMVLFYADTGEYPHYQYSGTDSNVFNWIGEAFFIKGNTNGKPSGVTISIPQKWNGPYLEKWPSKTPFGGYYTVFDYGSYNDDSTLTTVKKYVDNTKNLKTEYKDKGKKVVTIEIGFADDVASRDKAANILSKFMDPQDLYIQSITLSGKTYNQLIIPVLVY